MTLAREIIITFVCRVAHLCCRPLVYRDRVAWLWRLMLLWHRRHVARLWRRLLLHRRRVARLWRRLLLHRRRVARLWHRLLLLHRGCAGSDLRLLSQFWKETGVNRLGFIFVRALCAIVQSLHWIWRSTSNTEDIARILRSDAHLCGNLSQL